MERGRTLARENKEKQPGEGPKDLVKKAPRVGSPKHPKRNSQCKDPRTFERKARRRTRAPLKVEAIRWKGGEFKKSGRKKVEKEEEKDKEEEGEV